MRWRPGVPGYRAVRVGSCGSLRAAGGRGGRPVATWLAASRALHQADRAVAQPGPFLQPTRPRSFGGRRSSAPALAKTLGPCG